MRAMVSSEAVKPPTLTRPLARLASCGGVKERARSKATIAAGPPMAVAKVITTSSHTGAGPGHSSAAVHGTTIASTTRITMTDREYGSRATIRESPRLLTTVHAVIAIRSVLADAVLQPSPRTRNG